LPGNVIVVVAALLVGAGLSAKADSSVLLPPPPGKLYYGVYLGGVDVEDDITLQDVIGYETSGGQRVTWVYFSNNWLEPRVSHRHGELDPAHGAVPHSLDAEVRGPAGESRTDLFMEAIINGNITRRRRGLGWFQLLRLPHPARYMGSKTLSGHSGSGLSPRSKAGGWQADYRG
jgi:hypothetical protein